RSHDPRTCHELAGVQPAGLERHRRRYQARAGHGQRQGCYLETHRRRPCRNRQDHWQVTPDPLPRIVSLLSLARGRTAGKWVLSLNTLMLSLSKHEGPVSTAIHPFVVRPLAKLRRLTMKG